MKNNFFLPVTDESTLKLNLTVKKYVDEHQELLKPVAGGSVNVFYGVFPKAIWHGGRTLFFFDQKPFSKSEVEDCIGYINSQGIKVRMVFTNLLLEPSHLNDEYCNMILDVMDNGFGNGVIVASELLDDYIRKTHPNLPLISSITRGERLNTFQDVISKRDYEMVVIYAKQNILNYIDTIGFDKNKTEILLASGCAYCPIQHQHYEIESYNNLHQADVKHHICYRQRQGGVAMPPSPDEKMLVNIDEINNLGYYNMKIQGRGQIAERLLDAEMVMFIPRERNQIKKDILTSYYKIF